MTLTNILAVMLGGAIGAFFRFFIVSWVASTYSLKDLPLGTLLVNVTGSFLIGILAWFFIHKLNNEALRLFFIVGLLGSFTTVSSFSLETVDLLVNAHYLKGLLNIIATLILCLSATWLGLMLARNFMN